MGDPVRFLVKPVLRAPSMLLAFEGWNDAGEAATSALSFVEKSIQAVPLADIDPEEFYDFTVRRPELALDATGRRVIRWPANVVRFGSVDSHRELVSLRGIEPHLRWRHYVESVLSVARELQVERVVLMGAYLADVVYSRPVRISGFASHPEDLAELAVEASSYEGPTGIVGILAEAFEQAGIRVLSLWAGLPHYINASPNPRGALALVQILGRYLGVRMDGSTLTREAAEFEERISKLVSADPELSEYVRQLKRREFAQ